MSNLPLPKPDRRTLVNSSYISVNNKSTVNKFSKEKKNSINGQTNNNNLSNSIEANSLSLVKLKQIEDMRQKILKYSLLAEKSIFLRLQVVLPKLTVVMLFYLDLLVVENHLL